MYSLDVNFLKERGDLGGETAVVKAKAVSKSSAAANLEQLPLLIGLLVGLGLPAGAWGAGMWLEGKNSEVNGQIAQIEAQIAALASQDAKAQELQGQLQQAKDANTKIAQYITTVQPWRAILQDVTDQTPRGVDIQSIAQSQGTDAQNQPSTILTITGTARSYSDVNDFLLTLKKSEFFNKYETYLQTASLVNNPLAVTPVYPKITKPDGTVEELRPTEDQPQIQITLPKVVQYTLIATLNKTPSPQVLKAKQSKGPAIRLQDLQDKGVVQP